MTTTVSVHYGTAVQVTLDADALANGSSWQATAIDNTTNLDDDYHIYGFFNTASTPLGTNPVVTLYCAPAADGTAYADAATGTAGTFTPPTSPVSVPIAQIPMSTAGTAVHFGQFSLCAALGMNAPPSKFAFWVTNSTGLALAGSSSGNTANQLWVLPVTFTSA